MSKPYPIYNEDQPSEPGMYLGLFHGRKTTTESTPNWGSNGPLIGPLKWYHTTYYSHIRISFQDEVDYRKYGFDHSEPEMTVEKGGCVEFNGIFYGDWSVFHHQPK